MQALCDVMPYETPMIISPLCCQNNNVWYVCVCLTQLYLLYAFFWVIPRRLNFVFRRFETLCLSHLHRQVVV